MVGDMEEEFPGMDLSKADLPPASRETGSRLPISTIVDAMCYLLSMALETLGLIGTSKPHDTQAENNMCIRRKSVRNILGEIWRAPKFHFIKISAGLLTLLPTLRSDHALSMFVASEDNKVQDVNEVRSSKSSSRACSPDLYKVPEIDWPGNCDQQRSAAQAERSNRNSGETESTLSLSDSSEDYLSCLEDTASDLNSASWDDGVEADNEETDSTIMVSSSSLDEPGFLEDSSCKQMPGTQDEAEVTNSISVSNDMNETDLQLSERTHNTVYSMGCAKNRNTVYEGSMEITCEESASASREDQFQEVPIVSKRKRRRVWKGVKRQISHLFYGLFCCVSIPKKADTTPRAEDHALVCGF
ncbi:uncharacterized protein LOC132649195 [Meriones unguiculatus]|uniref:uncharacterized protein LOC132649195 n=1 Tax=Meriones unguiculatus TaxID=10047 RepID=UPI00293E5067|nr:uncharacterized protein LOC132649195 [Meriones unguiculatus]